MIAGALFILGVSYIQAVNLEKMARQSTFKNVEYVIRYDTRYAYGVTKEDLLDFQDQNLNDDLIRELYQIPR